MCLLIGNGNFIFQILNFDIFLGRIMCFQVGYVFVSYILLIFNFRYLILIINLGILLIRYCHFIIQFKIYKKKCINNINIFKYNNI